MQFSVRKALIFLGALHWITLVIGTPNWAGRLEQVDPGRIFYLWPALVARIDIRGL